MIKKVLLGLILIVFGICQLFAQEIVKSDSLGIVKCGRLELKFSILDSGCNSINFVAPKYPLGGEHLGKVLSSIKYPIIEDSTDLIEGIVVVDFMIDIDGIAKDVVIDNKIININTRSFEYIRKDITSTIQKLFKFEPAKCNGVPIKLRFNYKINYSYK